MNVSNYDPDHDPDGLPRQTNRRAPWLADYDDIAEGDTITVDLELLDKLAAAVEQHDSARDAGVFEEPDIARDFAEVVVVAARKLIADTSGDEVTP